MCVRERVCVCVCVEREGRERKRERVRETDRQTDRQTQYITDVESRYMLSRQSGLNGVFNPSLE